MSNHDIFYQKTAELFLYFLTCVLPCILVQKIGSKLTKAFYYAHLVLCFCRIFSFPERFISDPLVLLFPYEDDAL